MKRTSIIALALSASALVGIAAQEGYRQHAYDDGVGVKTIGYGTTRYASGAPVKLGDRTDPVRALQALRQDAQAIERTMRACLVDVPLYPYEWDAYVSLAYNIGGTAFCRSSLVKHLNKSPPDYGAACAEIRRWDKAGGRVLVGLSRRRAQEFVQCSGGVIPRPTA